MTGLMIMIGILLGLGSFIFIQERMDKKEKEKMKIKEDTEKEFIKSLGTCKRCGLLPNFYEDGFVGTSSPVMVHHCSKNIMGRSVMTPEQWREYNDS